MPKARGQHIGMRYGISGGQQQAGIRYTWRRSARPEQPQVVGTGNSVLSGMNRKMAEDIGDVEIDGAAADEEDLRDSRSVFPSARRSSTSRSRAVSAERVPAPRRRGSRAASSANVRSHRPRPPGLPASRRPARKAVNPAPGPQERPVGLLVHRPMQWVQVPPVLRSNIDGAEQPGRQFRVAVFDGNSRESSQGFEEPDDVGGVNECAETPVVIPSCFRKAPLGGRKHSQKPLGLPDPAEGTN